MTADGGCCRSCAGTTAPGWDRWLDANPVNGCSARRFGLVAVDEVRTGILFAPVVRGDVHTLLDMRSAVAIGVGMVLGKAALAAVRALARRATR